jgi:dihydroorotase
MSSMLALSLRSRSGRVDAAAIIGLADEIGGLRPGMTADVSVLSDERGRFILILPQAVAA